MKYLVTGATGHLGQKVVTELGKLTAHSNIQLGIHNMEKAAIFHENYKLHPIDYNDINSMVKAFAEIDTLIYIPSMTYSVADRIIEFENTLKAMAKAGVNQIVAISFIADQFNNPFQMAGYYAYLPARLASSKLNYAVIKNSLYADPLVPYLPELIERQNIIYPIGDQEMSFISQQDSAEAIANVAVKPYLRNKGQNYLLTMSKNYNMVELSTIMSQVTGKKIGYSPVSVPEFAEIYRAEGDGDELASMYQAAAQGLMKDVSNDFSHITGHQPTEMQSFLSRNYHN